MIETARPTLRRIRQSDYHAPGLILQDPKTMYAYEGVFTDEEIQEWLDKQLMRYDTYGFGLLAVILMENGDIHQALPWGGHETLFVLG